MSKYKKIDELIVNALSSKKQNYGEIHLLLFRPLISLCASLSSHITTFVVLDRRLQALRKRGVIEFDRENRVWRRNA